MHVGERAPCAEHGGSCCHSPIPGASLPVTVASQRDSRHQGRSPEKPEVFVSFPPELLAYMSNDRGSLAYLLCSLNRNQAECKADPDGSSCSVTGAACTRHIRTLCPSLTPSSLRVRQRQLTLSNGKNVFSFCGGRYLQPHPLTCYLLFVLFSDFLSFPCGTLSQSLSTSPQFSPVNSAPPWKGWEGRGGEAEKGRKGRSKGVGGGKERGRKGRSSPLWPSILGYCQDPLHMCKPGEVTRPMPHKDLLLLCRSLPKGCAPGRPNFCAQPQLCGKTWVCTRSLPALMMLVFHCLRMQDCRRIIFRASSLL